MDLRLANPLNLRNLLEDKRFTKNRLVLLHVSYPFSKEASYLASVYPQVRSLSETITCMSDVMTLFGDFCSVFYPMSP